MASYVSDSAIRYAVELVAGYTKPTKDAYKTLDALLQASLVGCVEVPDDPDASYQLTDKGRELLETMK